MMFKRNAIFIVAALMLLSGILPLVPAASAEPPSKADKSGHITADQTWSGAMSFNDVIIDEGVTVTVSASAVLTPDPDAYLWVRGTLNVQGTSGAGTVTIGESGGSDWQGITVNTTGKTGINNAQFFGQLKPLLTLKGKVSTVQNSKFNGGSLGVWISGTKETQNIDTVLCTGQTQFGVLIGDNTGSVIIDGLTIKDPNQAGLVIAKGVNVTARNLEIENARTYGIWMNQAKNVVVQDFVLSDDSPTSDNSGIDLRVSTENIEIKDGSIDGYRYGVSFTTQVGKDVRLLRTATGTNINQAVVNTGNTDKMDLKFIDCNLKARYNITNLRSNAETVKVHFINTTWSQSANIILQNKAVLNTSFYLDAKVVNAKGVPIPAELDLDLIGPVQSVLHEMPDGHLRKLEIKDRTFSSAGKIDTHSYNYQFTSTDYPINDHRMNNVHLSKYTRWTIELNLNPVSSLPATLEILEDKWEEYDLYDYFDDPDGEDMEFSYERTSDNITTEGNEEDKTDGEIRIKNTVKNWYGTGWVIFEARDDGDNSTAVNVTIEVLPVNDAPYFKEPLPGPVIDEDTSTFVNLTGKIADPENDPIIVTFPVSPLYTLVWNEQKMNLTITPKKDFFGLLEIPVNLTDGMDWMVEILYVIVRAVNDPPTFTLKYPDGRDVPTGEYPVEEGPDLPVYLMEIDEDTPVSFSVIATDVDDTNLTFRIKAAAFEHGDISQDAVEPWKFTYTPKGNDSGGDLVRVNVTDGKVTVSKWIWFKVLPVNDAPVFDTPEDWNIHVDIGTQEDLDIGDLISDVDGDTLTITVDMTTYVTVSGNSLQILVTDAFKGSTMEVVVTVSDGDIDVQRTLTVHLDNWVETFLEEMKVKSTTKSWKVEIKGDQGLTLYLVIEDAVGNTSSFPLIYEDGKYKAEVPEDAAEKDWKFWIAEEEGGDPIAIGYSDTLPSLKKESSAFPWWIILLILVLIAIAGAVLYLVFTRSGGYGGEVGDIEE
ncbi:MAG: Ig-like domain-containing protein [Thermoplasmatota archaeon]